MSNKIKILLAQLFLPLMAMCQPGFVVTQYQEVLPLINPAYSGIENATDINFGFRNQWNQIDNSPTTVFLNVGSFIEGDKNIRRNRKRYKSPYNIRQMADSVELPFNGIRSSNPKLIKRLIIDSIRTQVNALERKERRKFRRQASSQFSSIPTSKHGFSLSASMESQGAFSTSHLSPSYAFHIPLNQRVFMSVGGGVGYSHSRFDPNKAMVADPNSDPTYQKYLSGEVNQNYLYLNIGGAIYSDNFHFSYGVSELFQWQNQVENLNTINRSHNLIASTYIDAGASLLIVPSLYYSFRKLSPDLVLISSRIYYDDKYFAGVNYNVGGSIGWSLGLTFLDKYEFSFVQDYPTSQSIFGNTSELVLGICLNREESSKRIIR